MPIFISQDGRIIRQAFRLSGGSVGIFEGKRIGRAKNLEKLQAQIEDLKQQLHEKQNLLHEKQEKLKNLQKSTQKNSINQHQAELNQLKQRLASVRSRHEQLAEMSKRQRIREEEMLDRLAELKDQISQQEPALENLKSEIEILTEKAENLQNQYQESRVGAEQKTQNYNQQNIIWVQTQNHVKSLEKELEYKKQNRETLLRQIEQHQNDLLETEKQLSQQVENEDYTGKLLLLTEEKKSLFEAVEEAETAFYEERQKISESEKILQDLRKRKENAEQIINELQQKITESRFNLVAVKERLSVEFEIDLDTILKEQNPDLQYLTETELREKVSQYKENLQKIGAINHTAMEAYEEIKERHDFIVKQKDDLLKAKQDLQETIQEIEGVARERFVKAFEQIREHFIRVFRSLFSAEDSCDLKLSDPTNPVESSIEIIAKPKGKRPLTINQLSGGEKTLTATALLFSIYLLRPAPFCIFDEVDAPLDDANIDKFNNIIREFSKESQFIIVTHNKRTMASTDIMYGVTMLEQGVSRVLPIDLRSLEG